LSDPSNYIDIFLVFGLFGYFITKAATDTPYLRDIIATINILAWLRGV
jgi:hypothetical protein